MAALDRLTKLMALTNALGGNDFRDAQASAMRAGAASNLAVLPLQLQEIQQQLQFAPQRHEADLAASRADTEGQTLENLARISGAVQAGGRNQLESRGIDLSGIPQPLSQDQLLEAFMAVTQGEGLPSLPPQVLNQLQYDPRMKQLFEALQTRLQ